MNIGIYRAGFGDHIGMRLAQMAALHRKTKRAIQGKLLFKRTRIAGICANVVKHDGLFPECDVTWNAFAKQL
jgi:hypothetical protein